MRERNLSGAIRRRLITRSTPMVRRTIDRSKSRSGWSRMMPLTVTVRSRTKKLTAETSIVGTFDSNDVTSLSRICRSARVSTEKGICEASGQALLMPDVSDASRSGSLRDMFLFTTSVVCKTHRLGLHTRIGRPCSKSARYTAFHARKVPNCR